MDDSIYIRYLELSTLLRKCGLHGVYLGIMSGVRSRKQFDEAMAWLPDNARLMREDLVAMWKALVGAWGKNIPTAEPIGMAGRDLLFRPVLADSKCTLTPYYRWHIDNSRENATVLDAFSGHNLRLVHSIEERAGRGYSHFSVQCFGYMFRVSCWLCKGVVRVVLEISQRDLTEPMTQSIRTCAPLMGLGKGSGDTVTYSTFTTDIPDTDSFEKLVEGIDGDDDFMLKLAKKDYTFERLVTAHLRDLGLPLDSLVGRVVEYDPTLEHHFPRHGGGQWSIRFPDVC